MEQTFQPPAVRHEKHWVAYGNIVLAAVSSKQPEPATILFRVHSSLLSEHSEVFATMFELPQGGEGSQVEMCDGLPVVRLPDTSEEVCGLLDALRDPYAFSTRTNTSDTPLRIRNALHMASKYLMTSLQANLVSMLEKEWPATINDLETMDQYFLDYLQHDAGGVRSKGVSRMKCTDTCGTCPPVRSGQKRKCSLGVSRCSQRFADHPRKVPCSRWAALAGFNKFYNSFLSTNRKYDSIQVSVHFIRDTPLVRSDPDIFYDGWPQHLVPEPAAAIALAEDYNITNILPKAYYDILRCCPESDWETFRWDLDSIYDPSDKPARWNCLSARSWLKMHRLQNLLLREALIQFSELKLVKSNPDECGFLDVEICNTAWMDLVEETQELPLQVERRDILKQLRTLRVKLEENKPTCLSCRHDYSFAIEEARRRIWDMIERACTNSDVEN